MMTVIVSFTLSILLFAILGFRPGTHPMIYVTAGLLIAMGAWHIQTTIRIQRLKRQWKERQARGDISKDRDERRPALNEPNFDNFVPASVTDRTTRHLAEDPIRSAKP